MKKVLAAVGVVVLGTTLAIAGPGGKGEGKHAKRGGWSERLSEKLNLSDAQKQQIQTIQANFRAQNEPFFNSMRETRRQYREARQAGDAARAETLKAAVESQRAQMKQLHENLRQQISTVLTAEQRAQLEALKAEREARKPQRF